MYHTFSPVLRLLEIEVKIWVFVHQFINDLIFWTLKKNIEKSSGKIWYLVLPSETAFKGSTRYHIRDLTVNLILAFGQVPYNVTPLFVRGYPRILRDIS
jgi:hypothetical protein